LALTPWLTRQPVGAAGSRCQSAHLGACDLLGQLRDRGLIANVLAPRILRFVLPLVVSQEEIDEAVDILDAVLGSHSLP
jgi:4-aminobutyrate aminotransferase-like enzyme